jgi:hypothetical protein
VRLEVIGMDAEKAAILGGFQDHVGFGIVVARDVTHFGLVVVTVRLFRHGGESGR